MTMFPVLMPIGGGIGYPTVGEGVGAPPAGHVFLRGQISTGVYVTLRGQISAGVYVNLSGKTS